MNWELKQKTRSQKNIEILGEKFYTLKKGDITEFYVAGKELGKGAFSTVKELTSKQNGEKYAVKIVNKKFVSSNALEILHREIAIMKKLKHPNIIELVEVWESEESIQIVMELVTGGELFDHICGRGHYSERDASVVVHQLLKAVDFMHTHDVAHRDLKPQNLLCTPDGLSIKIADFGLSKIYSHEENMKTKCGTPDYIAPEILLGKGYSNAVDLWSVGVITYELLCGFSPFYAESQKELFISIIKDDFDFPDPEWTDISPQAKHFIQRLLEKDPNKRMTASQALEHEWLSGNAPERKLMESFKNRFQKHTNERKAQRESFAQLDDS